MAHNRLCIKVIATLLCMFPLVPTISIVSSPAGTLVSGSTFDYPILSSVTLTCMANPSPVINVSFSWNTTRCYTNT